MDEIGTVTVEQVWERNATVPSARFLAADPRVRLSKHVIAYIKRDGAPYWHLDGDVLTIRDDYGQRFIYRIRWDDYADGGYLAEWPD